MVNRPILTNINIKPLNMLKSYKILNTTKYLGNKVKNFTINNQQVFNLFFKDLRDYTRGISVLKTLKLIYSPKNNNLIRKYFSCNNAKLDPQWITGFVDAEGCFSIILEMKTLSQWKVRASFEINLHSIDKEILYQIKEYFGVGNVYNRKDRRISVYRVTSLALLNKVIIPHFIKYPLLTKKQGDFILWCKVIDIITNKEHLTFKGFYTILSYYKSINRGISKNIRKFYSNEEIRSVEMPTITLPTKLESQWVSGFVAGDGGFSVYPTTTSTRKKLYYRFHVAQHSKDIELMKLLQKTLNCGFVQERSNKLRCDFIVQDFDSIFNIIIPFFESYPLKNIKSKDFDSFKECFSIIKSGKHLTEEGFNKIKKINLSMNNNRLQ